MAITSTQKTEILKIVAGLFNAAPGGSNLTELANLVSGGMTTSELADGLATNSLFTNGIMGGKVTVEEQVDVLLNHFGLTADSDPASAGSQAKTYFTNQINNNVGFGKIVFDSVTFLSPVSPATVTAGFETAATLLANKAAVADAYSSAHSSSDLSVLQNVLSSVKGDHVYTPAEAQAIAEGVNPSTSTLTTGTDNVTGTSGNDTIIGEFNATAALTTINPSDQIGGGGGTDTFKVFGDFTAATTVLPSSISSIETLYLAKLADAAQDLSTQTKAVTGIEKIEVADASLVNGRTITTSAGQSLSLATAAGVGTAGAVTWASSATDTTLNLALNGYQGATTATPAALTVTGAAATTLNIASTGGSNVVSTFTGPTTVTSHVISGDKSLHYTLAAADAAKLSSIDASANTGGVTVADNAALTKTGFTFTGGAGNDTISFINDEFGTLTAGTQLKGGDGSDKIGLFDTAISGAEAAKIQAASGFEKIGLNAAITLDASTLSNYKIFDIDTTALTQTINELATGSTVNVGVGASAAFTAISLTTAGAVGISDVTVNLGGAGDLFAHTITALVTTGLTNVNLSSNGTVANTITGITNSDNSKFAVTGSADLTMALAAGTAIASQVDASAFTGKLTVTGSSMTGSGDKITGGSGADTINGLKGADILTGGGGADTFTFTSAAGANANGATFGTFDEIKDFVAGTDKLQFSTTDVVSGQQAAVQTAVTALAAGSTAAQIATAMSAANPTNLGVSFAVYEGNTYVLYETTGATAGGAVADDVFIKLTGVTTAPTFAADVIA